MSRLLLSALALIALPVFAHSGHGSEGGHWFSTLIHYLTPEHWSMFLFTIPALSLAAILIADSVSRGKSHRTDA